MGFIGIKSKGQR